MSAIVTGYSTPASAAKDYSKGAQKGTFTSYEERAAESGGEVLYGLDKELAEKAYIALVTFEAAPSRKTFTGLVAGAAPRGEGTRQETY